LLVFFSCYIQTVASFPPSVRFFWVERHTILLRPLLRSLTEWPPPGFRQLPQRRGFVVFRPFGLPETPPRLELFRQQSETNRFPFLFFDILIPREGPPLMMLSVGRREPSHSPRVFLSSRLNPMSFRVFASMELSFSVLEKGNWFLAFFPVHVVHPGLSK